MTDRVLLADGLIDLRLGRWQDVLADVTTCDAVVMDPPYSARTHEGMRVGDALTGSGNPYVRVGVAYETWTPRHVREFCQTWTIRTRGWIVAMTSHDLCRFFERSLCERYVFPPIPFVEIGKQPRLSGDGPASWTCWIMVSRPKTQKMQRWGSLPGAYVPTPGDGSRADRIIKGGKPLGLMRAIVRDYTRPGDLVVDPFCGGGTTALACAIEGRRCITSEMDPVTFEKARKRLERGFTPNLFQPVKVKAKQGSLV